MKESQHTFYTNLRNSFLITLSIHSTKNSCGVCGTTWLLPRDKRSQAPQLSTKQLAAPKSHHSSEQNTAKELLRKGQTTPQFKQLKARQKRINV